MKWSKRLMMVVLIAVLGLVAEPIVAKAKTSDPASNWPWKREIERRILASAVRIEWSLLIEKGDGGGHAMSQSVGHATIKAGRYLVTHNHLGRVSLTDPKGRASVGIAVRKANGELIWEGPLAAISVAAEDAEMLVLDFGSFDGQGTFTRLGMGSAEFSSWESLPLEAGMEVAQVDWDGVTAHVDWTMIEDVITDDGTPRLKLANFVREGASGGGVFLNGNHVANNWSQVTVYDKNTGEIRDQYSIVALNSAQAAAEAYAVDAGQLADSDDTSGIAAQ